VINKQQALWRLRRLVRDIKSDLKKVERVATRFDVSVATARKWLRQGVPAARFDDVVRVDRKRQEAIRRASERAAIREQLAAEKIAREFERAEHPRSRRATPPAPPPPPSPATPPAPPARPTRRSRKPPREKLSIEDQAYNYRVTAEVLVAAIGIAKAKKRAMRLDDLAKAERAVARRRGVSLELYRIVQERALADARQPRPGDFAAAIEDRTAPPKPPREPPSDWGPSVPGPSGEDIIAAAKAVAECVRGKGWKVMVPSRSILQTHEKVQARINIRDFAESQETQADDVVAVIEALKGCLQANLKVVPGTNTRMAIQLVWGKKDGIGGDLFERLKNYKPSKIYRRRGKDSRIASDASPSLVVADKDGNLDPAALARQVDWYVDHAKRVAEQGWDLTNIIVTIIRYTNPKFRPSGVR
jgi:hypothetical protein